MTKIGDKVKLVGHYRERVYRLVRRIPRGRVMTYGQIAIILGEGYTPRTVGFVMHGADETNTPWHRVINSRGACSTSRVLLPPDMQERILKAEGVKFNAQHCCDLGTYLWNPDGSSPTLTEGAIWQRTRKKGEGGRHKSGRPAGR